MYWMGTARWLDVDTADNSNIIEKGFLILNFRSPVGVVLFLSCLVHFEALSQDSQKMTMEKYLIGSKKWSVEYLN